MRTLSHETSRCSTARMTKSIAVLSVANFDARARASSRIPHCVKLACAERKLTFHHQNTCTPRVSVQFSIFLIQLRKPIPSIERYDRRVSASRWQHGSFGEAADVNALTVRMVACALTSQHAALRREHDNHGRAEEVHFRFVHFACILRAYNASGASCCCYANDEERESLRHIHLQLLSMSSQTSRSICSTRKY